MKGGGMVFPFLVSEFLVSTVISEPVYGFLSEEYLLKKTFPKKLKTRNVRRAT